MIQIKKINTDFINKLNVNTLWVKDRINYKSIQQRTKNLLDLLESCKDVNLSNFTNSNIYIFNRLISHTENNLIEDVFKLDKIDNFIGDIPLENQEQIITNIKILKDNPIIDTSDLSIYILAPEDCFIATSNRTALDPIAFAKIRLNNIQYLIPISQWL